MTSFIGYEVFSRRSVSPQPSLVPMFIAFAAGAMIFVSLHELMPMAKQYGRLRFFGLGMLASVAVYGLLHFLIHD